MFLGLIYENSVVKTSMVVPSGETEYEMSNFIQFPWLDLLVSHRACLKEPKVKNIVNICIKNWMYTFKVK